MADAGNVGGSILVGDCFCAAGADFGLSRASSLDMSGAVAFALAFGLSGEESGDALGLSGSFQPAGFEAFGVAAGVASSAMMIVLLTGDGCMSRRLAAIAAFRSASSSSPGRCLVLGRGVDELTTTPFVTFALDLTFFSDCRGWSDTLSPGLPSVKRRFFIALSGTTE